MALNRSNETRLRIVFPLFMTPDWKCIRLTLLQRTFDPARPEDRRAGNTSARRVRLYMTGCHDSNKFAPT